MNIEIRGESKNSVDALKINFDQAILDIFHAKIWILKLNLFFCFMYLKDKISKNSLNLVLHFKSSIFSVEYVNFKDVELLLQC